MDDDNLRAPLARFDGARPPAPVWFDAAQARVPERSMVPMDAGAIELLTWGDRGKPGLLLLHGSGAHADWWSFIAPFFADDYRVAALSWSGMGASPHREHYDLDGFVAQIFAGADVAGLFDGAARPLVVAHSFGGYPMMAAAAAHGHRFRAAVIVDTPFRAPGEPGSRPTSEPPRAHRVYPTLTDALARFRFAPEQPCDNLFIADHIARHGLAQVDGGWQWRFDPYLWSHFNAGDQRDLLAQTNCPAAFIWGDRSKLITPATVEQMRARLPAGSPMIPIPDAAHHVMVDQPLAFVAALRALFAAWPQPTGVGE